MVAFGVVTLNYRRGCPVFDWLSETFGVAFLKAFFELLGLLAELCKNDSNADFSRHQVRIWNAIEKKCWDNQLSITALNFCVFF